MGLTHGHVRAPLADLSDDEKAQLKQDVSAAKQQIDGQVN